LPIYNLFI